MALIIDIDRGAGTLEVTSEDRVYIRDESLEVTVNGFTAADRAIGPWIQIFSCDRLMAEAELTFANADGDGPFSGQCSMNTDTVPFVRAFAGCRNETCRSFGVRVFSGDVQKPIALGSMEVWNFPSAGGEPALLPTAHEIVKALDDRIGDHIADMQNPHHVTPAQIGAIPSDKEREFANASVVSNLLQTVQNNKREAEQAVTSVRDSLSEHVQDFDNPHNVTAEQLGLGNVDNTRDVEKPMSNQTRTFVEESFMQLDEFLQGRLSDFYEKNAGELYTKEEVDRLVSAIPKFKVEVVSALPTTGFDTTTVYLVKTGDDGMNLYTEYIRVDNKWEMLGTQKLDLRNYATKIDLSNEKNTLQQLIDLKQGKLVAGTNITIDPSTNTIDTTGLLPLNGELGKQITVRTDPFITFEGPHGFDLLSDYNPDLMWRPEQTKMSPGSMFLFGEDGSQIDVETDFADPRRIFNARIAVSGSNGMKASITKDGKEVATEDQISDAIITIKQGGVKKGSFSLNQAGEKTIELDAGGGGGAVKKVADVEPDPTTGNVPLTASDVGALPITGGTIKSSSGTSNLNIGGGGSQGKLTVWGSSSKQSQISVLGEGASISKNGEEVATEEKVNSVAATSAYPMAPVVGGALKDRTINISASGGTFTFPARTGDNTRDFVVRIRSSSAAPSVTFPEDVDYESDQDDVWTAEADKANEWYFSESEPGLFKVMHKALVRVEQ